MTDSSGPARDSAHGGTVDVDGLRPVRPLRLSDDVADQIRALIIREDIAAGARLPSERDLAERFRTSRPTVSQALRTLSIMGLVEIRHGSGAYVVRRPETMVTASLDLMLDLDHSSVGELLQLRLWLEALGAEEAARRDPQLAEHEVDGIRDALQRLGDSPGSASEWIAVDTVFHATVVRAAGNPYLSAVYESIHTTVLKVEFDRWIDRDDTPSWLGEPGRDERWALHQPIADAVIRRDWEAARAAVHAHHRAMLRHFAS